MVNQASSDDQDRFDLARFVAAQAAVYARVLEELRAGRKRSHWMWFIFPQIRGLGASAMSVKYAINSLDEARAYLQHELLGARLRECAELVTHIEGRASHANTSIEEVFGYPDNLKFHSSMTLFARVAGEQASAGDSSQPSIFEQALQKYFAGVPDQQTLNLL